MKELTYDEIVAKLRRGEEVASMKSERLFGEAIKCMKWKVKNIVGIEKCLQ